MGLGTHFRKRLRSCNRNKIDSESATGSYTVTNAVQSRGRMNVGRPEQNWGFAADRLRPDSNLTAFDLDQIAAVGESAT